MMFKRVVRITVTLGIMIFLIPSIKALSITPNKGILLIYDSYNIYGNQANILNIVNRVITETNEPVDVMKLNSLNKDTIDNLEDYSNIVVLNCNTEKFSSKILEKLNKEKNKIMYISNIQNSGLEYKTMIPILENNNDYFNFRNEILNGLITEKVSQNRYLMINNVTPFIDLNKLVDKIKYLNSQGIPFILNAIPVFENPTFKAMQNFTEVLRYAQASGGYVVLSSPYINQGGATSEEIFNAMVEGYKNYINYLVYPIGISMPNYLMYRSDFKSDLEKSNTVFVSNGNVDLSGVIDYKNPIFKNVIQEIPYKNGIENNINSMSGSVAVTIDNSENIKDFEGAVQSLLNSGITFNNPRSLNSEIDLNGNKVECTTDGVYLNGKYVQQNSYISNQELSKENTSTESGNKNQDIDISKFSNKIIVFAIVACIIFIIITILSKRIDRKKYFR